MRSDGAIIESKNWQAKPPAPLSAALVLCLTGCGYVGEPLYPALNIPNRVVDLTVVERGGNLDIYFTKPALTTEGLVVKKIGRIELQVGPQNVAVPVPDGPGVVHATVSVQALVGQEVAVRVRTTNPKGRASEWSNVRTLEVKAPLATPAGVTVVAVRQGVQLAWKAAGEPAFRVYRKEEKELLAVKMADVAAPRYLDTTAHYGVRYEYWVQGVNGDVESELAGPFAIQPKDEFAPAVPAGLAASTGLATVELAWERNTEADFKGYRVYRAAGGGPFEKVADLIEAPSYSDNKIESGKRYQYAVSSVDQNGNESERSAPVQITAP